jgi:hypothetical protein
VGRSLCGSSQVRVVLSQSMVNLRCSYYFSESQTSPTLACLKCPGLLTRMSDVLGSNVYEIKAAGFRSKMIGLILNIKSY